MQALNFTNPSTSVFKLKNILKKDKEVYNHVNTSNSNTIINNVTAKKKDFAVIDTIRFLAICSIVWGHCNLGAENAVYHRPGDLILQSIVLQAGRIGTIIFFLISGFLIAPKLHRYTPLSFLKERFNSTILPWMAFVTVFILLNLVNSAPLKTAVRIGNLKQVLMVNAIIARDSIFYFAYWFIIVFLISSLILVIFKKYVNNAKMGLVLAAFTLFYSVNLHHAWISVHHTKAFVGYAFFMWLGVQISNNYKKILELLSALSWKLCIGAFFVTFLAACFEGFYLQHIGCADPYASIRFSNIINSVISFACLIKMGQLNIINRLEPRRVVYGVYLLHNLLIYEMINWGSKYFSSGYFVNSAFNLLFLEIVAFAFILSLSILLVNAFGGLYNNVVLTAYNRSRYTFNNLVANTRYSIQQYNNLGWLSGAHNYRLTKLAMIVIVPCIYLLAKMLR